MALHRIRNCVHWHPVKWLHCKYWQQGCRPLMISIYYAKYQLFMWWTTFSENKCVVYCTQRMDCTRLITGKSSLGTPQRHVEQQVQLNAFLTSTLYGGDWLASPAGKQPPKCTELETVWMPQPVQTFWRKEKSLVPAKNWTMMLSFWHP